jgi:hypothetical protein
MSTQYYVNGYNLSTSTGSTLSSTGTSTLGFVDSTWYSTINILHSDSTTTLIGSNAAPVYRPDFSEVGIREGTQSNTFVCTNNSISVSDRLQLLETIKVGTASKTVTFVSDTLNSTLILSGTWTITRYTYLRIQVGPPPFYPPLGYALFYFGSNGYVSFIDNIQFGAPVYLTFYNGTTNMTVGCISSSASPLKFYATTTKYGISLVSITAASASALRFYDGTSIKAIAKG